MGDNSHERTGNQVIIKAIYWKVMLSADADDQFRVVCLQDKFPQGSLPTSDEIYADTNLAGIMTSLRNLKNTKRFKIHFDKVVGISGTNGSRYRYLNFYKKLNVKSEYDGTTGGVTQCKRNGFYIVVISEKNSPTHIFTSFCRVRFIDP